MAEAETDLWDLTMKASWALMKAPQYEGRSSSSQERDIAMRLRESIRFRQSGVRFHQQQLLPLSEFHRKRLPSKDFHFDPQVMFAATWQLQYLFDDIVFSVISGFDYLANAVWFGFHRSNHWRRKWNRLVQVLRDPEVERRMTGGVRMHDSATARAVLEAHSAIVDSLYGYRSDLIHVAIDSSGASASMNWGQEGDLSYGLLVTAPENFLKNCGKGVGLADSSEASLLDAAEALVRTSEGHNRAILMALCADLDPDNLPLSIVG